MSGRGGGICGDWEREGVDEGVGGKDWGEEGGERILGLEGGSGEMGGMVGEEWGRGVG